MDYSNFKKKFADALNKHAPKKIKTLRGKQKPHINKRIRKAISKRLQLKKANKTQNVTDVSNYKRKRNYLVKLSSQCKTDKNYSGKVVNHTFQMNTLLENQKLN